MAIDLMANGSFEGPWTDLLPYGALTNQQPAGFHVVIRRPGTKLLSAATYKGHDDPPVFTDVGVVPECVHKLRTQLPATETGPGGLILAGDVTYKVFAAASPFSVDLVAWLLSPQTGWLDLSIPVQVHQQGDGSPGAAVWQVLVGAYTSPWLTFGDFEDRRWFEFGHQLRLERGVPVRVALRMESRALAGIDFFTDAWRAMLSPDSYEPEGPTPGGYPARALVVDYSHVTGEARRQALYREACDRGIMVGPSHDHVRAWPPGAGSYTVELADIPPDQRQAYAEYYVARSPEIEVVFRDVPDAPTPPPEPPPSPPPPPTEPQYTLRSGNLIGLHSSFFGAQHRPYIETSRTTTQKFFSAGDCWHAKQWAPELITIWRKFVGNEEGRISEMPTIRESARWYLDQYTAEMETAARNMGMTVAQLLTGIDAIESLNETIPSFNPAQLQRSVEFDCCFAEEARRRFGQDVETVLLNGAIGNPHESEVHYLLPAAEAVYELGGFLGYHAYWTANRERSYMAGPEHWPYHAGRWMAWDDVFRSRGVYPRYVATEGGIVFAPDGVSFNSGLGWRACGSFERYLADIAEYNRRVLAWNAQHGNRCAGLHVFCYAQWGWDSFLLGDGEVILLNEWARTPTQAYQPRVTVAAQTLADVRVRRERESTVAALEAYLATATYITDDHRARAVRALAEAKRGG